MYILASARNGMLYIGVTSNLIGRVAQHREGIYGGSTKRYGVHLLVWLDVADTMEAAIAVEKRVKRWPRKYKLKLIERDNPRWKTLPSDLAFRRWADPAVDPGTRPR